MTLAHSLPAPPLKTYSAFSGIAGIELGLSRSGAAIIDGFCEQWAPAQAVLRAQFALVPLSKDVAMIKDFRGASLVTAGFPCTDLSQAGQMRGLDGSQSGLVLGLLRLLQEHRPAWLLLENVPNMLHLGKGRAMERIVGHLEEAGYSWAYRVVDSRFTGLAQRRRRVLLVASHEQDPAPLLLAEDDGFDASTVPSQAFGFSWTEGNRGLGWADGAVPTLKGGSTRSVASPPAVWLPGATEGNRIVRPTIEAAEVLQGFEPNWTAAAPARDRWKLVGNAVSTRVAQWVGDRLVTREQHHDVVWREELLANGSPWPAAARGGDGKRWRALVSEFPRSPSAVERQDLVNVLEGHGSEPLSHRATRGFRDRLIRSNLRYRDDFRQELDAHVAYWAP